MVPWVILLNFISIDSHLLKRKGRQQLTHLPVTEVCVQLMASSTTSVSVKNKDEESTRYVWVASLLVVVVVIDLVIVPYFF